MEAKQVAVKVAAIHKLLREIMGTIPNNSRSCTFDIVAWFSGHQGGKVEYSFYDCDKRHSFECEVSDNKESVSIEGVAGSLLSSLIGMGAAIELSIHAGEVDGELINAENDAKKTLGFYTDGCGLPHCADND